MSKESSTTKPRNTISIDLGKETVLDKKIMWLNTVLSGCNLVKKDNTSDTVKWCIEWLYNLFFAYAKFRAEGSDTTSIAVDMQFLEAIQNNYTVT